MLSTTWNEAFLTIMFSWSRLSVKIFTALSYQVSIPPNLIKFKMSIKRISRIRGKFGSDKYRVKVIKKHQKL